jgi:CheY-like chemotaxis protein
MSSRPRILLLDDDPDVLELYRVMLSGLASEPEVRTTTTGARAIALLESEPFTLLLCDLNMPKMDGLQVLAIVRRKYPQLRTAIMTSVVDDQFRGRAYAMGVDLYLEKPGQPQEKRFFMDCIESLLGREDQGGFRGVQSKSLVDIIQLEGLSQSSSVLKVTNGALEGKIWFQNGDIIDAATHDLTGEAAFKVILSWKAGNFEVLPPDTARPRVIFNSYQGLLLETAQALDEAEGHTTTTAPGETAAQPTSVTAEIARVSGVEFVLRVMAEKKQSVESWGLENVEQMSDWVRFVGQRFQALGERLQFGQFRQLEGFGLQRHVAVTSQADTGLCVGFRRTLSPEQVRETMKHIVSKWAC